MSAGKVEPGHAEIRSRGLGQQPEVDQVVDRLGDAAGAERPEGGSRTAGHALGGPGRAARRPGGPRPVSAQRSAAISVGRPRGGAVVASRTLRKPCCSNPVSGSVFRTAWCSPAVRLEAHARGRRTARDRAGQLSLVGVEVGADAAGAQLRPVAACRPVRRAFRPATAVRGSSTKTATPGRVASSSSAAHGLPWPGRSGTAYLDRGAAVDAASRLERRPEPAAVPPGAGSASMPNALPARGARASSSSRAAGHDERRRPARAQPRRRCRVRGTAAAIGASPGREQRRVVAQPVRTAAHGGHCRRPPARPGPGVLPVVRRPCRPRPASSGRNVSTMTASSSKYSAPSDRSTAPGCGPCACPPGCRRDRALADARALAGLVVAVDVEHDLVGVDVRVVVGHRDRQRVVVDLARHEVADDEVVALEDLVHRRRLVHPAGDRLEVGDVERVRVQAAVPADDVERVLRRRRGSMPASPPGPSPRCLT